MSEIVLTRWPLIVREYLGSDTLRGMTLEAEGLWLRLALDQWEHGAARADEAFWRSAHGHRTLSWAQSWASATSLFEVTDNGLVSGRVARDRERCIAEIEAKKRGARKTNAGRGDSAKADSDAQRADSGRSAGAKRAVSAFSASSSDSASDSDLPPSAGAARAAKAGAPVAERTDSARSAPAQRADGGRSPRVSERGASLAREIRAHWCDAYRALTSREYAWRDTDDSAARKLASLADSLEVFERAAVAYFASRDGAPGHDYRLQTIVTGWAHFSATDAAPRAPHRPAAANGPANQARAFGADTSAHQRFVDGWCALFLELKGAPYHFNGGKDGRHAQDILTAAVGDVELALARARALLTSPDPFYTRTGIDLGTLRSQWNRIASADPAAPAGASAGLRTNPFLEELRREEAREHAEPRTVTTEPIPA